MEVKEFVNHTVANYIGLHEHKGNLFGLELELEGLNVAMQDVACRGWNRKYDGSLRGEAIEYVSAGPKTLDDTKKMVTELFEKFKENNVKLKDSIRTSTHVHLNFSDKIIKSVVNFFALFTLLEEVLQYYSGEDRKGNLFCISSREAEGIVGILAAAVGKCNFGAFAGDRYKYAACNLSTLYKFGTVEIRTMKGATSAEHVNAWVDILNDMYEYSLKMKSPASLVDDLSILGAEGLMQTIFSPANFKELMKYFPKVATLHYSLMEGARLIQVFAYEFDDEFTAEFEFPKKAAKEKVLLKGKPGAVGLPLMIERDGERDYYQIYKPDGTPWVCETIHGRDWRDGDRVADDQRIQWSDQHRRFIVHFPDNNIVICRWKKHHVTPDEGRPVHPLMMPERDFWGYEDWGHENEDEDVDEMDFDDMDGDF